VLRERGLVETCRIVLQYNCTLFLPVASGHTFDCTFYSTTPRPIYNQQCHTGSF